jgi:hypothetical protein
MNKTAPTAPAATASELIDARIQELGDWRGQTLARVRALIQQADPEVLEEWKWRGVPVWSHAGIVCTGETYKSAVKLTFAHGAELDDPAGLFNASLEGNTRRAIDIHAKPRKPSHFADGGEPAAARWTQCDANQGPPRRHGPGPPRRTSCPLPTFASGVSGYA